MGADALVEPGSQCDARGDRGVVVAARDPGDEGIAAVRQVPALADQGQRSLAVGHGEHLGRHAEGPFDAGADLAQLVYDLVLGQRVGMQLARL